MQLVELIYKLTNQLPKEEIYGLSSQARRAAVSIPSNIAEGRRRGHRKEFIHFLLNSYGSGAELETQLEIMNRVHKLDKEVLTKAEGILEEVMKMLNVMINKLTNPTS